MTGLLLLTLLLAQAPVITAVSEATAALQSVRATAILLKLPARDLTLVKTEVDKTLKAMKKTPDQARCEAAESLIRLTQRIGSTSYERVQPFLFAAGLVIGPPCQVHATDPSGKPIANDQ